jgi:hypothetical protein
VFDHPSIKLSFFPSDIPVAKRKLAAEFGRLLSLVFFCQSNKNMKPTENLQAQRWQ